MQLNMLNVQDNIPVHFYIFTVIMKYLRLFLLPFSILYGVGVVFRNVLYDAGIFKTRKFFIPIITVGNLDVGGAGKSPMTEYLIRLLKGKYNLGNTQPGLRARKQRAISIRKE